MDSVPLHDSFPIWVHRIWIITQSTGLFERSGVFKAWTHRITKISPELVGWDVEKPNQGQELWISQWNMSCTSSQSWHTGDRYRWSEEHHKVVSLDYLSGIAHKVFALVAPNPLCCHHKHKHAEHEHHGQPDSAERGGVFIDSTQQTLQSRPVHACCCCCTGLVGRKTSNLQNIGKKMKLCFCKAQKKSKSLVNCVHWSQDWNDCLKPTDDLCSSLDLHKMFHKLFQSTPQQGAHRSEEMQLLWSGMEI